MVKCKGSNVPIAGLSYILQKAACRTNVLQAESVAGLVCAASHGLGFGFDISDFLIDVYFIFFFKWIMSCPSFDVQ